MPFPAARRTAPSTCSSLRSRRPLPQRQQPPGQRERQRLCAILAAPLGLRPVPGADHHPLAEPVPKWLPLSRRSRPSQFHLLRRQDALRFRRLALSIFQFRSLLQVRPRPRWMGCHGRETWLIASGKWLPYVDKIPCDGPVGVSARRLTVVRSPRTKMLRALKTLQRQNDTRRLRPMSMNRATDNDAVSGHSEALLGWVGTAIKRV